MSRIVTTGVHPENGETVQIAHGWDEVFPFKAGYFFQVFSLNPDVIKESDDGEGCLVNEGFLEGISEERFMKLVDEWSAKI